MNIVSIAGYKFVELTNLAQLKTELQALCENLGIKGTILLSEEGINQFLAGEPAAIAQYRATLATYPWFCDIKFIENHADVPLFAKLLVKIKPEIITTGDRSIQPDESAARRISPETFKQWLEVTGKEMTILDTRNTFEVEIGTFAGATHLNIARFSDFQSALKSLDASLKRKPIVIFCTGGIRCEKAAPMLAREGFEEVYQLEGGILTYLAQCGDAHFNGKCFVFDKRVTVDNHSVGE